MSIEIVYDRRFIRTTRGIIPLVLAGSSNCYEEKLDRCGRPYTVAERRWTYFFNKDTLEMPEEQLLTYIRNFSKSRPDGDGFRHRGKMLLYSDIERWYSAGIRSAYPLEAYLNTNPSQLLHCYLTVYPKTDGKEVRQVLMEEHIRSTEQLEAWMDRYKTYRIENEKPEENWIYPCIKFRNNEPLHMPMRISGPVIARYGRKGNSYVSSYEKGKSVHFSPDIREAKVFSSVDEAYELMGNSWGKLHFVKTTTPTKVKSFVIRLDGGKCSGDYIAKKSASRLFTTGSCMAAMRFGTPGEALRYAKNLREKGFYESSIGKFVLRNLVDDSETSLEV